MAIKSNAGQTFLRLGQADRALKLAEEDALLTRAANNKPATALSDLLAAKALVALGRHAEARKRIVAADELWYGNPTAFRRMLLESRMVHADIDIAMGDVPGAHARITDTLAWANYPVDKKSPGLDRLLRQAARISLARGDARAALQFATDARALSGNIARDQRASADVGHAALLQAEALDALGRQSEARSHLDLAVAALAGGFGEDQADTARARMLAAEWGAGR